MNVLQPNSRFHLFRQTYQVDCINGSKVRFHNEDDVYDVWELSSNWLQQKQREGKLVVEDA